MIKQFQDHLYFSYCWKKKKEELKHLLMNVKEENSLKLNIQKIKIMESGSITTWKIGKK